MLLLVAILSFISLAGIGGCSYVVVKDHQFIKRSQEAFNNFFQDDGEGNGSDFSKLLNATIEKIKDDVTESVRQSIVKSAAGTMGGTMKGVNAQLEQIAIENNPQASLFELLPKSTKKNPLARMGLMYLMNNPGGLSGILGGGTAGGNGESYQGRKHRD